VDPFTTTTKLAEYIHRKELSAREAVAAYIARIESRNPALNAIVTTDFERALAAADAADAALARGERVGPLHGVPFTLKDSLCTAGVRTTVGAPPFADHVPAEDSFVAARLRAAGAILLGKTNVPPFLMSAQTDNPLFGRTNNPWNVGRTAGGSSGGSASAVAAALVPFDIGSDLSGSIRLPAHFCGVFGLKPTVNRIPITGHIPPPPGVARPDRWLCTVGPIARSAADLALVASVLAMADRADHEVPPVPWRPSERPAVRGLRVAFRATFADVPTSKAVSGAVTRLAHALEAEGAIVEERDPGFSVSELNAVWKDHLRCMAAIMTELFGSALPVKVEMDEKPTATDLCRALAGRDMVVTKLERFFDEVDAFLSPASIATAFPHAPHYSPIPVDGEPVPSRWVDHYVYPFSLTGHPAVVVPVSLADDGLPVGAQLVGPRWGDERLVAIAESVAEVAGALPRPPAFAD
jgi:amidase